jgi:hypothetical protein
MGAATPACLMPSALFAGRVADEKPRCYSLQVTRIAYATAVFTDKYKLTSERWRTLVAYGEGAFEGDAHAS